MHRHLAVWTIAACGALGAGNLAVAQEPVAIVENAAGSAPVLQLFDTLHEGQEIVLEDGGSLEIGYFASCIRESIDGGRVVVGKEQSAISGGAVTRETVACAGGQATLADSEAAQSGALVLRAPPSDGKAEPLKLFSATPVFLLPGANGGELVIRRIDRKAADIVVAFEGASLDLAEGKQALRLGGFYEARFGTRALQFEIDPRARYSGGPLIGRLVPL